MSSPKSVPSRPAPRLYLEADLGQNRGLTLYPEHAHYLNHVMRAEIGDEVRLFNGRDGEWRGKIASVTKKATEVTVTERLRAQKTEPDIRLCCAPIKKAHFEYMIEKVTELGVTSIEPLLTARTQIREVNEERCRLVSIEAAEQSERLGVPEIKKPVTFEKLAKDWPKDRLLIVCAESGNALPAQEAFMRTDVKAAKKTAIVTGPEGGFAPDELELMRHVPGSVFIRLGPRILRADTAAIAALSCWQSLCGDWTSASK